ncbi:MAG: asparagine synthase (glutamine-hydrolyzing) [bacterium]|nr:asparagine synthase (glutamine-hydrolyzing) [bacterium]
MCGIAGLVDFSGESLPENHAAMERMVQTLVHRGPDSAGMGSCHGVSMGMRRLAIIDLAGGDQPIYNEDRSIWTVFNGEIYNFPELKKELQGYGHRFSTHTDTEIIVHAYEQWGRDFPSRLNGMFAIALHDSKKRLFALVRDHLGIKPLYYARTASHLVFGSEIKALLASGLIERSIDLPALADFLSWEYTPGAATLFAGIRKLLPSQMLWLEPDNPEPVLQQYWDIPTPDGQALQSASAWQEEILAQVRRSTRMQMISDVPLGAFLSGGVDSSLLVACMGRAGVQTFSIGFDDPSYNELGWARRVADHLGVDHRDEIIRPDVVELFGRLMHFLDDPIGDFSIFPTYLVSRLARRHVTVALSGDGGDELFAGYETYLAQEKSRFYQRLPAWMRRQLLPAMAERLRPGARKKGLVNKAKRFIEGAALDPGLAHARWRLFVTEELRSLLFTPEARAQITKPVGRHIERLFAQAGRTGKIGQRSALDQGLYVDVRSYLSDNILTKVDRMSMAVSLETRVPYLDKDLVELAFRVPAALKLKGNTTKSILKEVATTLVPRECVYRPKEGFSIPIKHWLNSEFKPLVEDLLDEQTIRRQGLFNPNMIARLKDEHRRGTHNHSHILWSLIVFHDWQRRWLT